MKKRMLCSAVLAVMLAFCLSSCGEKAEETTTAAVQTETDAQTDPVQSEETVSSVSPSEMTSEMIEADVLSSMADIGDDRIGNYLSVDMEKVEDFSLCICGSGAYGDEIAVFKLSDTAYASELIDEINRRIESRSADFKDYNPDEYDKLCNAVVEEKNGYVFYAVSADNDKLTEIFEKYVG